MKLIIATIVLAVLVAFAPQTDAFRPIQEVRCVLNLLNGLSNAAAAEQAWIQERQDTFAKLEAYRENCEQHRIPFIKERCLDSHKLMHTIEVTRTLNQIREKKVDNPAQVARLLRDFEQCRA